MAPTKIDGILTVGKEKRMFLSPPSFWLFFIHISLFFFYFFSCHAVCPDNLLWAKKMPNTGVQSRYVPSIHILVFCVRCIQEMCKIFLQKFLKIAAFETHFSLKALCHESAMCSGNRYCLVSCSNVGLLDFRHVKKIYRQLDKKLL